MINKVLRTIKLTAVSVLVTTFLAACSNPVEPHEKEPDWSDWSEGLLMDGVNFIGIDSDSTPLSATDLKLYQSTRQRENNDALETEYKYTVVGNLIKTSEAPDEGYFTLNISLIDEGGGSIDSWNKRMIPGYYFGFGNPNLSTIGDTVSLESSINVGSKNNKPSIVEFTDIEEFDKNDLIRLYLDAVIDSLHYTLQSALKSARSNIEFVLSLDPNNKEALYLQDMIDYKEEHGELPEKFWDFYQESEDNSEVNDSIINPEQNTEAPPEETPEPQTPVSTDDTLNNNITNPSSTGSANDVKTWKDAYLGHVGGSSVFGLFDMGAENPVLIVRSSTILRGSRYTMYGFHNGRMIRLSEDGTPLISYENGFVSVMSMQGINDYFRGFYIDELLKFLDDNRGVTIGDSNTIGEAGIYVYDMSFHKDFSDNYVASNRLDRKMDDPTSMFLDLKRKAESMPGQVETWKMENTDVNVIINWGN